MMSSLNSEATKDAKAWNNTFFDVATESGSFELSKGAEKWATTVARHMNTEMQRSTNKYGRFLEQFFPPQGDLRKWAQKSGQTMHDTLSDALFATITDDWKSWQDGLHSLWLVFCRTITNDLSSSLMKATGLKQGSNVISQIGSWIGSLLGHTSGGGTPYEPVMETATGGVFYRPTMRLIGEGGPEAVVPLSQYNNGRGGGGGVTIHVHTPDATSFIRSKTQIMSEYAAAARTAARRRGYANG